VDVVMFAAGYGDDDWYGGADDRYAAGVANDIESR